MTNYIRIFGVTDAKMLETAYTLHSLFNDHIADFTTFDTQLDAAFATTWLATIETAATVVKDSQIKDIQAQLTDDVLVQMDLCRKKYIEVKYFVGKAFPNSPKVLHEFGGESYTSIRDKQGEMVSFMDEMNHSCQKYTTELLAVGITPVQIDDVLNLRNSLLAANTEQENYMRGRPLLTQKRIVTLNECYLVTRTVVEAAMSVYYDDPASKNMFVFNRGTSSGGGSVANELISLTIMADDIPVLIFAVDYVPTREYILANNGPAEVEFYIADTLNGNGFPIMLLPGDNLTVTADMLGISGNLLIAKAMMGPEPEAHIEVEISMNV